MPWVSGLVAAGWACPSGSTAGLPPWSLARIVCTCWSSRLCFSGMGLCATERARRPEPQQAWEGAQEAKLVLAWVVSLWCEHGLSAWIWLCVALAWCIQPVSPVQGKACPLVGDTLGSAPVCLLSPPKPAFDRGEPGHSW